MGVNGRVGVGVCVCRYGCVGVWACGCAGVWASGACVLFLLLVLTFCFFPHKLKTQKKNTHTHTPTPTHTRTHARNPTHIFLFFLHFKKGLQRLNSLKKSFPKLRAEFLVFSFGVSLKTKNSKLKTQNCKIKTHNGKIKKQKKTTLSHTAHAPKPRPTPRCTNARAHSHARIFAHTRSHNHSNAETHLTFWSPTADLLLEWKMLHVMWENKDNGGFLSENTSINVPREDLSQQKNHIIYVKESKVEQFTFQIKWTKSRTSFLSPPSPTPRSLHLPTPLCSTKTTSRATPTP